MPMRATPIACLLALMAPALAQAEGNASLPMVVSVMVLAPGAPAGGGSNPRSALESAAAAITLSRNAEAETHLQHAQAGLQSAPPVVAQAEPNAPPLVATVARARHALATGDQRGAQLLIAATLRRLPAP